MKKLNVRQMLVPKEKYKLKCPYTMKTEFITVHNTYNNASANNEVKYMNTNNHSTSFHFAVDDVEIVQGIPYDKNDKTTRNAWHAGDGQGNGNRKSVGIEICYSKSGGAKYEKAEQLAVEFIAQLLHERNWGINKVRKHHDWSGKNCPHRILNEGRWASFLKRIETALNQLKNPTSTTPKPTPPKQTNEPIGTIKVLVDNLNYYNAPRWKNPSGQAKKNTVFTVMEKVKVDDGYQYRLKSGTYITAHTKYVAFTPKK